jgi:hypothetical protein
VRLCCVLRWGQERYNLPSAGSCPNADGSLAPCKQWFIRITDESTLPQDDARPEVFFSGNLHGDEQVWLARCADGCAARDSVAVCRRWDPRRCMHSRTCWFGTLREAKTTRSTSRGWRDW